MDFFKTPDFTMGPLTTTFVLGFITLSLLLWYTHRKMHSYWKKMGIPYVKASYPIFGSILESFTKPTHDIELDRYAKYGRIYGHYEGHRPLLSVADPELLRSIFVKDFHTFPGTRKISTGDNITENMLTLSRGETWKRIRTIVTPTFTTGKIKRMLSIFNDSSRTLVQNFKEFAKTGKPIETKIIFGAFSMDVIASSAFSTKIDSHNDPNNEFVRNAKNVFKELTWRFVLLFFFPSLMKIFRISVIPQKVTKFFSSATLQIIEERNRTGQKRNDFLQLLLDTSEKSSADLNEKDDIMENYGKDENSEIFKSSAYLKKTLSRDELVAQCVAFFLAGYDTTASTLSFISYNLALHPDIQERLIEELDDALRENGGQLTYEVIQSMKYLDNVISETLRLYPPTVRLERLAEEDYTLGHTGVNVPKGMIITIPIYAIHRDPDNFPDPDKFDPDRFNPEERMKRDQYSYLPFGAGPRNCVGMRFVLVEIKVCLAHVLSNFRIKKCSETKVPLQWLKGQGLLQAKDVTLLFELRNDANAIN